MFHILDGIESHAHSTEATPRFLLWLNQGESAQTKHHPPYPQPSAPFLKKKKKEKLGLDSALHASALMWASFLAKGLGPVEKLL